MAPTLTEQFSLYQGNVTTGMAEALAEQLGVASEALVRLGAGWIITDQAWAFAERDADGVIVGVVRRFLDGAQYALAGSKRGLAYEAVPISDGYDSGRQAWLRVTRDEPCPICGRDKWCGVDGSADPPRFVKCHHQPSGSVFSSQDGGHIHELIKGSFRPPAKYVTALPPSEYPVLVVEGHSDVAAALSLGFQAVGKYTALGVKLLPDLLRGRSVVVIGEHDGGDGMKGMEKAFQTLKPHCPSVVKIVPPPEFKDLRAWLAKGGLTQDELLQAISGGSKESEGNVLDSKAPLHIAERWLREEQSVDGVPVIRKRLGEWYRWDGRRYTIVQEDDTIRGPLYKFLDGMSYIRYDAKGAASLAEFETTRSKINDIQDAMNMTCPVYEDAPCWLDGRTLPHPTDLISFGNGVLDVGGHLAGSTRLIPASPILFNTTSVPYDFDPRATCPQWLTFLSEALEGDAESIALVQEWIGYCMIPDTSMEKMMMIVGRPGSGKSTFLDVMREVIGQDQCFATTFRDMCGDFGLESLVNKLAIILADAHVPQKADSVSALERLKSITGRDHVPVGRKFLKTVNQKLVGRFTIAVNELPELPDHARSLERRLLLLYFPQSFVGYEDTTLKDRLPLEAPGIAVWALRGLKRLRKNGAFTTPTKSIPVIEEFRRSMTPEAEFMADCCVEHATRWVPKQQAYDAWSMWAKEMGLRPGIKSRFGQRLLAHNPSVTVGRKSIRGRQMHIYNGIGLTDEAKVKYLMKART